MKSIVKFLALAIIAIAAIPTLILGDVKKLEYKPVEYKYPVKYADINGIKICYMDEGQGDHTIIFVHGLTGNMYEMSAPIEYYKANYRVVALDLPGHGNSERRNDIEYGIPLLADTVKGLMDHLKIDKAIVAGVSMGGHTAAYFAWKYKERTEAAVLIDAAGLGANFPTFANGFMEKHPEWIAKKITENTRKHAANGTTGRFYSSSNLDGKHGAKMSSLWDASKKSSQEFVKLSDGYYANFIWTDEFPKMNYAVVKYAHSILSTPMNDKLAGISAPTLIVWGDHDTLVDIQYGYEYAKGIRNSYLAIVKDAGHIPQVEEPEQFFAAMDGFLARFPKPHKCMCKRGENE